MISQPQSALPTPTIENTENNDHKNDCSLEDFWHPTTFKARPLLPPRSPQRIAPSVQTMISPTSSSSSTSASYTLSSSLPSPQSTLASDSPQTPKHHVWSADIATLMQENAKEDATSSPHPRHSAPQRPNLTRRKAAAITPCSTSAIHSPVILSPSIHTPISPPEIATACEVTISPVHTTPHRRSSSVTDSRESIKPRRVTRSLSLAYCARRLSRLRLFQRTGGVLRTETGTETQLTISHDAEDFGDDAHLTNVHIARDLPTAGNADTDSDAVMTVNSNDPAATFATSSSENIREQRGSVNGSSGADNHGGQERSKSMPCLVEGFSSPRYGRRGPILRESEGMKRRSSWVLF